MPARALPDPGAPAEEGGDELRAVREALLALQEEVKMLRQRDELRAVPEALLALQEEVKMLRHAVSAGGGSNIGGGGGGSAELPAPTPALSHSTSQIVPTRASKPVDRFLSAALKRSFPMWVLPIRTLLSPSFQMFRPHEELRDAGALVEWQPGMSPVLFCSHTWLRHRHPDSAQGDKFKTLTGVLRRILAGELDISTNWIISLIYGKAAKRFRCKADALRRNLAEGFIFFDYMSIPQASVEDQQRAIASLVSYVSDSAYFFVLAGAWTHEDGSHRDELAWADRGWCRMEQIANMLSPSSKPMVVVRSPSAIEAYPPGGVMGREWTHHAIVGRGKFTVPDDRLKLAPHLKHLISARKAQALSEGDLEFFRYLHARTATLLDGTELVPDEKEQPYAEWMREMRFESVHDSARSTGITPIFYAILAGRRDLVCALLERGADVHTKIRVKRPQFVFQPGNTPIGIAAAFLDDYEMIQLLLSAGADAAGRIDENGGYPLHRAFCHGNLRSIEALIAHDPSLLHKRDGEEGLPMTLAAYTGRIEALRLMKERYPEALAELVHEKPNAFGCSNVGASLFANSGDLPTLEMLLDEGEDIDLCGAGRGKTSLGLIRFCDLARHFAGKPKAGGMIFAFAYGTRVPPLHCAAMAGNLGAIKLLVRRGASLDIVGRNPRKMTPLMMATLGGHIDAVAELLEAGARTDLKDARGATAADWAKRLGLTEIRQLLLGAAAEQAHSGGIGKQGRTPG